ncbi:hypothetical protein [Pontibacter akesuensis]|uniref:Uncharacterized protein n=1 Tax=Pontibacter akesuensis TaxID=388950 RepID=A0A1I7GMG1_9BACT|nr:hypothetical protein [Pontibacter akesuensis]GHA56061.1 hypothetical protein GCM10007389_04510 [Pontibacter akesuensis]SFU49521.1 hypothetical protein SAMN04487941_1125 [Pontibacter akesuensis]
MVTKLTQTLQDFEDLVTSGGIKSFQVSFQTKGLWIKADQGAEEQTVTLPEELLNSLLNFFYGVECINYRSHDYTNLKGFINAKVMLERLLHRNIE